MPNWTRITDSLITTGVDVDTRSASTTATVDWSSLMDTSPFQPFDGHAYTTHDRRR